MIRDVVATQKGGTRQDAPGLSGTGAVAGSIEKRRARTAQDARPPTATCQSAAPPIVYQAPAWFTRAASWKD